MYSLKIQLLLHDGTVDKEPQYINNVLDYEETPRVFKFKIEERGILTTSFLNWDVVAEIVVADTEKFPNEK